MDKVEVLMKEYQFLRDEILDSNKMKYQIVGFGTTSLAIIFGGSATAIKNDLPEIGEFLLFGVLPLFSITVLLAWVGEIEKVQRIANHQLQIENRVNAILGQSILTFENALRKNPLTIAYSHIAIALFLCFIAVAPGLFQSLISRETAYWKYFPFIPVSFFLIFFAIKFNRYRYKLSE